MSDAFVWFHHGSDNPDESKDFYCKLLSWTASEGPGGMPMFALDKGPFAATGPKYGDTSGWIPFVEVQDVDTATKKAIQLGGTLLRDKGRGPAGEFSIVRDPSGAAIGLWQKA